MTAKLEEDSPELRQKRKQYLNNQKLKQEIKGLAEVNRLARNEERFLISVGDIGKALVLHNTRVNVTRKSTRARLLAYAFLRGRAWQDGDTIHRDNVPDPRDIIQQVARFWAGKDTRILAQQFEGWLPGQDEFVDKQRATAEVD